MSAAAGYKPVHGGYPGEVPKAPVYVVAHADENGVAIPFNRNEKYDIAWISADQYGGDGDGTSEQRGQFSKRCCAERYCAYRSKSGETFAVFEL